MRYILSLLLLSSLFSYSQEKYLTPFEKGNGNQSTTYEECIAYYRQAWLHSFCAINNYKVFASFFLNVVPLH